MARPPLTVVVATRNRPTQLARCLTALQSALAAQDEIVVVDSASTDTATADVATASGVRLLRAQRPGTSLARNIGWRAATHALVAFTDDDVEVDATWPDAMASSLAQPDRSWVTGWIGVHEAMPGAEEFNPLMLRTEPAQLDGSYCGPMGASANFGVRRQALADVGGYDERLGPGTWTAAAEDAQLFDRLITAGHVGRYEPGVRVYHEQWRSRRDAVTLNWRYGKGMGARLAMLRRQRPKQARDLARDVMLVHGLVTAWKCARARYELGALLALLRVIGTGVGFIAWAARR